MLLSADNVPWVTDFGLSTSSNLASMSTSSAGGRGTIYFRASAPPAAPHPRACSSHARSNRRAGRARTQAPELFAYPPVVSAAADVYAFAVLAWVVCTREQPYQKLQSAETAMAAMLMQATPNPTPNLPLPL